MPGAKNQGKATEKKAAHADAKKKAPTEEKRDKDDSGDQTQAKLSTTSSFDLPDIPIEDDKDVPDVPEKREKRNSKGRNRTVVYGAADDDDLDLDDYYDDLLDDDDDYGYTLPPTIDDDADDEDDLEKEAAEIYSGRGEDEGEDMWEDEEGDDDDEQRLEDDLATNMEALLIAHQEMERIRAERLAEIKRKKEILIERYLKVAKVLISLRKKNIYLQDYLYHLALRKGILRGDPPETEQQDEIDVTAALNKAQVKRQKKTNVLMASRFAKFLRLNNPADTIGGSGKKVHRHHHHHHHGHHHHQHGRNHNQVRHSLSKLASRLESEHTLINQKRILNNNNSDLEKVCQGKECLLKDKRGKSHPSSRRSGASKENLQYGRSRRPRPLTIQARLEMKVATTLKEAFKKNTTALDDIEHHRCKLAKKKESIKISKLLKRYFAGTELMEGESDHLTFFVEHSLAVQNLARRKAMRKQKKPEKVGLANLNRQWVKSLERIRELRLRKAKLEEEHRLQLIRKVKHWHVWEKRDLVAVEAVYDFVANMSARVNMTQGEASTFATGLQQFQKQLHTLYEAALDKIIAMFKAKMHLCLAQRRIRDTSSVISNGLTLADFERMTQENQESHDMLVEKQIILLEEHEKLTLNMEKVAKSHLAKQRSWGALRAGRHDMKALWEMCRTERNNLLRKLREIRKNNRRNRRLFVQISLVENKACFLDYKKVHHSVELWKDRKRTLLTQLHHAQSTLQALNTVVADIQHRTETQDQEKAEKVTNKALAFCRTTVERRLDPCVPNTIYSVNIGSHESQTRMLEKECRGGRKGRNGRVSNCRTFSMKAETADIKSNKLPPV